MLLDDVLAEFRGKIDEMRAEVTRRRSVTAVDPVADTTEYWAGWLEESVATLARRLETLSPAQYAAVHGATASTVRRWCEVGELPGARKDAAGEWRIPRAATRRHVRGVRRPSKRQVA